MTAPADDDDDLLGRLRRRPRATPGQAPAAPPVAEPPAPPKVGTDRLLEPGGEQGAIRRGGLSEAHRWEALKMALSNAGPDLRWRAVGWVLQQEVAFAWKVAAQVREGGRKVGPAKPRKADLIDAAREQFARTVEFVEQSFSAIGPDLSVFTGAISRLDTARQALGDVRRHLQAVEGDAVWAAGWAGADVGKGIPGYDTPGAVEEARRDARAAHEAWKARKAQAPKRGERIAEVVEAPASFAAPVPSLFDGAQGIAPSADDADAEDG